VTDKVKRTERTNRNCVKERNGNWMKRWAEDGNERKKQTEISV
jgi:hypothetical protein